MTGCNLVIVESAAKSKTISKYLNSSKELKSLGKFTVTASFGHVRDLIKKELGIDVDAGFKPNYQIMPDKKAIVADLKKKVKECDNVYLAADPDREGESIAEHLKEVLNLKRYKRITFTEITQKALEEAIKNPRLIDNKLVDAQETRRTLDRLVGFKLSPLLWKQFSTGNSTVLSAGRVQSAVLHMIIKREKDIEEHKSESYWTINGNFDLDSNALIDSRLYKDGVLHKIKSFEHVTDFLKKLHNKFTIHDISTKLVKQSPDFPFITSTLQQEAYTKLGFGLKKTMQIAQSLYENGYITYMRTDSYNMSEKFKEEAENYIQGRYKDYYAGGRKKKSKGAQEAHECIRITDITKENISLENDHVKLYEMIWKRTIASLMKPCIYDELEIKIKDASFAKSEMWMLSTFKKLKYNGYLVIYGHENESYDFSDILTRVNKGFYNLSCHELFCKNTWSSPPQRYNDSTLVKLLEHEGLGRPSTYSSIISKLIDRQYVIKSNVNGTKQETVHIKYDPKRTKMTQQKDTIEIGAEKNKLVPTVIGNEIDSFLENSFPYIVDKNFTAVMENDLDSIAEGHKEKLEVLNTFWGKFNQDLSIKLATKNKTILKTEQNAIDVDGKSYIIRIAKYGPVIQFDKNYINLKSYLTLTKKEYMDIGENDIRFLISLPRQMIKYKGHPVLLTSGPYGLYLKYDGKNLSISKSTALDLVNGQSLKEKDMDKILDYHSKKKAQGI